MSPHPNQTDALLRHFAEHGTQSTAALLQAGFSASLLTRLVQKGAIERVARGVYAPTENAPVDPQVALVEACARVPRSVICLLSALAFHDIGTQQPRKVWLGLPRGSRPPRNLALQTIQLPDWALILEVQEIRLPSGTARVTTPARTVVECIKHRRKVGLDTCQEALRETLRRQLATPADLDKLAERFRVKGILRPWLEALT